MVPRNAVPGILYVMSFFHGFSGPEEAISIMLAPYPLADERLVDAKAETDMEAVKAAIHAGRSLRSSYGILPSVRRPNCSLSLSLSLSSNHQLVY